MRIKIDGSSFEAGAAGKTLAQCIREAGISLDLPCNGRGSCGKCRVRVKGSLSRPTDAELDHLTEQEIRSGVRLACQAVPLGDCSVESYSPVDSASANILVEGFQPSLRPDSGRVLPLVRKHVVNVPPPDMRDQRFHFERLVDSLASRAVDTTVNMHARRDVLLSLPSILSGSRWRVTVARAGDLIMCVEPGDTTDRHYGIAFDVGTTTVVGYLIDLRTGSQVAVASRTNPQISHGADLVSRITYSAQSDESRETLSREILGALNDIVGELVATAMISSDDIYHAVVAGNTCMTHMLLGLETASLATMPYVGLIGRSYQDEASQIGIGIRSGALVTILPNVGGFVGSDTVAAAIAGELDSRVGATLMLDLGTNGELVLSYGGRMLACSTAAGPAFEGAHVVQGMRGVRGAIESVVISDGDVRLGVIGGGNPLGICGSGLVQAVAGLVSAGIVDWSGRLRGSDELQGHVHPKLVERVRVDEPGPRFVLFDSEATEIALFQSDIRELQLAKGAICAGFSILCKRMGLSPSDVDTVLLAGAFGNYVDKDSAVRIGMLPGIERERIVSLGNAAGAGAKMALSSEEVLRRADELARAIEYVELGNDPEFQEEFMEAMGFPAGALG